VASANAQQSPLQIGPFILRQLERGSLCRSFRGESPVHLDGLTVRLSGSVPPLTAPDSRMGSSFASIESFCRCQVNIGTRHSDTLRRGNPIGTLTGRMVLRMTFAECLSKLPLINDAAMRSDRITSRLTWQKHAAKSEKRVFPEGRSQQLNFTGKIIAGRISWNLVAHLFQRSAMC
jgi:hypothetical protein